MSYYRNKNVLVTGGAGLIGHELVRQLLECGAHVRGTVYRERKIEIDHPSLEIVTCDLMGAEDAARVVRDMDIVFHAAGHIRGAKGQQDSPADVVTKNLLPSINVIDAAVRSGVERFGWLGSSTVYPDVDRPLKEEEAFIGDPLDRYFGIGWVKRYGEKLCTHFHRISNTRFAIIRSAAVYGPHERFTLEDGHVLPALIIKAARRLDPFPVWGDGEDVRDFVHVEDLAEGFLLTVEKHPQADPINIATGVGHRIQDAVRIILDVEGYRPRIVYQSDQPSVKRTRLLDVGKAKSILQFQTRVGFEEGLRRTIEWYKTTLAEPSIL